jgi:hypothetical protein
MTRQIQRDLRTGKMPRGMDNSIYTTNTTSITVSPCYVPYSKLESSPMTLYFGKVPIHLVLASPSTCLVSVPSQFRISDSDMPGAHMTVIANLGTSFIVSYKGDECEVRLGRRITILNTDTYTSS